VKLLLTGATGFVGRNFLLRAIDSYERVHLLVRDPDKLRSQMEADGVGADRVRVHDVRSGGWGIPDEVDHVVHAAAALFGRDREQIFAANVGVTLELMEHLKGRPRILLLSSQSAGGAAPEPGGARNEQDPDRPLTWYGESKKAMEGHVRERFCDADVRILRPPMILGPRDLAEAALFKAAGGALRIKPGFHSKRYSWIGVSDLTDAIGAGLRAASFEKAFYYVAARDVITDRRLLETAARVAGATGITLPVPEPVVRAGAAIVDRVRPLRRALPSLTRDRAREIWERDMVVDGSAFEEAVAFRCRADLEETLRASWQWLTAADR